MATGEGSAETQDEMRHANQRLVEAVRPLVEEGHPVPFLCECLDRTCMEAVPMTLEEYAEVRSHPRRYAVRPGHPTAAGERVVRKNPGFDVTEKAPD